MDFQSYQELFESEVPRKHQREVPNALVRAYDLTKALMEDTPFLNTDGGLNARGHLIQCAVDYQLVRLIESGIWPFDYEWTDYSRPTGKHLRVISKNSIFTVSRLQNENQFPRSANFRNNLRLNNDPAQLSFFYDETLKKENLSKDKFHFILGHGYHVPDFARFYIPHSEKNTWNWRTENIMDEKRIVQSDAPAEEKTKKKIEPEIKEEFKEWIEKNGSNHRKL